MAQLRSPTLVTLGRMVRTFRDAAGLTQKEFAKKLGYTNGWVSNVETAQLRPRSEQVTAMERALGVPPGALMNIYEQLDGEVLPGCSASGWTRRARLTYYGRSNSRSSPACFRSRVTRVRSYPETRPVSPSA
jgi:transcriptional regulator with XRE-family HTH domain